MKANPTTLEIDPMAVKKRTRTTAAEANDGDSSDQMNPPKGAKGWDEVPSTATMRWWVPDVDESVLVVTIKEASVRETRFGKRPFYVCEVMEDSEDTKGELEAGTIVVVWESAGLRDLSRFVGTGELVRLEAAGKVGRTRAYRFFTKGGSRKAAAE